METNAATGYLKSKLDALRLNQTSHYKACEFYQNIHYTVGIGITVLSTISLGFALTDAPAIHTHLPILLAAISFLAAILAGVHTFTNFSNRSKDHQMAAVGYGKLVREIESRISGAYSEEQNAEYLEIFKLSWAEVSSQAPLTKFSVRKRTKKYIVHK